MPTCPNRHETEWTDYCGVCGARMAQTEATPVTPTVPTSSTTTTTSPAATELCPHCGETRESRFCEGCGHDFVTEQPSGPASWVAVVAAGRSFLDARGTAVEQVTFPADCPERRIVLNGHRIRIGRRSLSRGITPEIDLSGDLEDAGVSRIHAQLLAQPDGSWALVDKGSANGTYVNNGTEPLPPELLVPLADGDMIRLGIRTTITLRKQPP